jgi:hypothetical protein
MAIVENGPAPYAPPSAVISLIERYRNHGLSTPFTQDVLMRAGVTEALAPRTLHALKLLDLVGEDGEATEEFITLQRATTSEFPEQLQMVLRAAYQPIFSFCDPATATADQVRDAFRGFTPIGQQSRAVTLFLRLCAYSGMVVAEAPRERTTAPPKTPVAQNGRAEIKKRRGRERKEEAGPAASSLLMGVTDDDVAALTEDEFEEVWAALGKVARARARSKAAATAPGNNDKGSGGADEEVTG